MPPLPSLRSPPPTVERHRAESLERHRVHGELGHGEFGVQDGRGLSGRREHVERRQPKFADGQRRGQTIRTLRSLPYTRCETSAHARRPQP